MCDSSNSLWETVRIALYLWPVIQTISPILWPYEFFLSRTQLLVEPSLFCDPGGNLITASRIVMGVLSENGNPGVPEFHPTILGESTYSMDRFVLVWTDQNLYTQIFFFLFFHRYKTVNRHTAHLSQPIFCRTMLQVSHPCYPWEKKWSHRLSDSTTFGENLNFVLFRRCLNVASHTFLKWKSTGLHHRGHRHIHLTGLHGWERKSKYQRFCSSNMEETFLGIHHQVFPLQLKERILYNLQFCLFLLDGFCFKM